MKQTALYSINPSTCDNEVRAIDYGAIIYSHTGTATIRINFDQVTIYDNTPNIG